MRHCNEESVSDGLTLSASQQVALAQDEFARRRFGARVLKPQTLMYLCEHGVSESDVASAVRRLVAANTWLRAGLLDRHDSSGPMEMDRLIRIRTQPPEEPSMFD